MYDLLSSNEVKEAKDHTYLLILGAPGRNRTHIFPLGRDRSIR